MMWSELMLSLLCILPSFAVSSSLAETGLLIVGGRETNRSVEYWTPNEGLQCMIPSFKRDMTFPTVDTMHDNIIACYGRSCDMLVGNGWEQVQSTIQSRSQHTSASTSQGILLIGGQDSPSTTELIPVDGGESREGFNLEPRRADHCSIQVDDSTVILTGGLFSLTEVTEYSGVWDEEVISRDLPSLDIGRWGHACGIYTSGDSQMLLVTGGTTYRHSDLSSTEIIDYRRGMSWRQTSPLPSPRWELRGINLMGILQVMGGKDADEVLTWDGNTESWVIAGHMDGVRRYHGVTEVPHGHMGQYCTVH